MLGSEITVRFTPSEEPAVVLADEGQMRQVLLNLIVNARDAMPSGGTLEIATTRVRRPEGLVEATERAEGYVCLSVRDSGTGMNEATRARIFEPFFTTKDPGKGSGLGLATVFGIVTQSGGSLDVVSEPGKGSTFRIFIPIAEGAEPVPAEDADERGGGETILVVEDDARMLQTLSAVLLEMGYRVLEADRPSRALEVWREHRSEITLLVSDVAMPEMSGLELAARIRDESIALPVLFVTGDLRSPELGRVSGAAWLPKPFTSGDLLRTVRALLKRSA
jgi:CheY-like chemotaxis protein